jgi:hypothetical protein
MFKNDIHLRLRITLWLSRSVIKKGILYSCCLSTCRCTCRIELISSLMRLLYPFTRIGLSSGSKGVFKNLDISLAHLVSKRAKAFALVLPNTAVLTLLLFLYSIHRIVKFFLLINQLRLTIDKLISFYPKEETSLRVLLFLSLYYPLSYP